MGVFYERIVCIYIYCDDDKFISELTTQSCACADNMDPYILHFDLSIIYIYTQFYKKTTQSFEHSILNSMEDSLRIVVIVVVIVDLFVFLFFQISDRLPRSNA